MFKKVKTLLYTLTASIMLLAPALAMPLTAHAAGDIVNSVCTGTDLNFTTTPGTCTATTGNAVGTINNIVTLIINVFSVIVGIVAVIMIVVGGFRYVTSGGNDQNVASAKNTILYAIIGLVIVALAQIIVKFVLNKVTQ